MTHKVKILKWIKRILIGTLIFLFTLIVGFYLWLNLRLDSVISENDYNSFVNEIKSSKDLPLRFHKLYNKVYKVGSTNEKYLNGIVNSLFRKQSDYINIDCPCKDASYGYTNNELDNITLALALDRDVGSKKCIDYYLRNFDFLYHNIGVENASRFYFKKEIKNLTDDEMLALIISIKNPAYYNLLKHSDRIEKEINKIKNN